MEDKPMFNGNNNGRNTENKTNEQLVRELRQLKKNSHEYLDLRNLILTKNTGLVETIANKFITGTINNAKIDRDDLVQQSYITMVSCIENYEIGSETSFATYVQGTVRHELAKFINMNKSDFKMPRHLGRENQKIKSAETILSIKLGHTPTPEEVSNEIGIPVKKVTSLQELSKRQIISKDKDKSSFDDSDSNLEDIIPDFDHSYEQIEDQLDHEQFLAKFEELLNTLDLEDDQIQIIMLLVSGYTRKDIIEEYEITTQELQQVIIKIKQNRNFTRLVDLFDQFYERDIYSESYQNYLVKNGMGRLFNQFQQKTKSVG